MSNMSSITLLHYTNLLFPKYINHAKEKCPLQNQGLTPHLIFKTVSENSASDDLKIYFGLAQTTFKKRFINHTKDIHHKKHEKTREV